MKKFISALTAGLVAACLMPSMVLADTTELLSNTSFEDPIEQDTSPTTTWGGFTGFGIFPVLDTTAPNSGASHLILNTTDADGNGVGGTFQGVQQSEFGIIEGEEYTFSFLTRAADQNDFGINAEFRIEWLAADGTFVDRNGNGIANEFDDQFFNNQGFGTTLTDSYQLVTQSDFAPVGATELRVVIAAQTFGSPGTNGSFFVDDGSLTGPKAIPEPASAGLVALTLVGLVSRRRR